MDRRIEVRVSGAYLDKDSASAGVQHEANATELRISFDEGWEGFAKTVTFWDALMAKSVKRTLTADLLEDGSTRVYTVPIPGEALSEAGEMTFVIDGYAEGKRKRSVSAALWVSEAPYAEDASEPGDPTPTQAEQLQAQVDDIIATIAEAKTARNEAKAAAQQASEDAAAVSDALKETEQYGSDAAQQADRAQASVAEAEEWAQSAAAYATRAEAAEANAETAQAKAEAAQAKAEAAIEDKFDKAGGTVTGPMTVEGTLTAAQVVGLGKTNVETGAVSLAKMKEYVAGEITAVGGGSGEASAGIAAHNASSAAHADIRQQTYTLLRGTEIPANADLNTYTTVGNYCCVSDTWAKTLGNCPSDRSFTMRVFYAWGESYAVAQELVNGNTGVRYYRWGNKKPDGWTAWNGDYTTANTPALADLPGTLSISKGGTGRNSIMDNAPEGAKYRASAIRSESNKVTPSAGVINWYY